MKPSTISFIGYLCLLIGFLTLLSIAFACDIIAGIFFTAIFIIGTGITILTRQ